MSSLARTGRSLDQDWVDKANGFWSVLLLAACSFGAFLARYLTQPISCWAPPQFPTMNVLHLQRYCFLQTDMLIQQNISLLQNSGLLDSNFLNIENGSYHLWIPLILFLQAVCFKIPNVIWTLCKSVISFNYDATISTLEAAQTSDQETRSVLMQRTARLLHKLFQKNNTLLVVVYMIIKLMYLFNLLAQFIFLTVRFGRLLPLKPQPNFLLDIIPAFKPLLPINVFCRFQIFQIQNVQTFMLQCQLSISEIYEKLYVFLWFWIFFLALATFLNLVVWAGFLFIPFLRDGKISAYLNASPKYSTDSTTLTRFVSGFLGIDGVFLMSMISKNSSEMVAADLSQEMFQVFLENDHPLPHLQPVASTSTRTGFEAVSLTNMNYRTERQEKPPEVVGISNAQGSSGQENQAASNLAISENESARHSTTGSYVVSTMDKPLIDKD